LRSWRTSQPIIGKMFFSPIGYAFIKFCARRIEREDAKSAWRGRVAKAAKVFGWKSSLWFADKIRLPVELAPVPRIELIASSESNFW